MDTTLPQTDLSALFKGERVSHLYRNNAFFAHLSIYYYALQFAQDREVLDAGSGAGYGAAYLAEHGARQVLGVDVSDEAVAFSQAHFQRPNLEYRQLDLEKLDQLQPRRFDMIYSSNVLEHVPNVDAALRNAAGLLKPDGVMVIAVPPICGQYEWEVNVMNSFHLNIWTPRQWLIAIERYFGQVQPIYHNYEHPDRPLFIFNKEEETTIDETNFMFEPCDVGEYYRRAAMSAMFVARQPKNIPADALLARKFVEGSFTRPLREPGTPIYRVSSLREARLRAQAILHSDGFSPLVRRAMGYVWKGLTGWKR